MAAQQKRPGRSMRPKKNTQDSSEKNKIGRVKKRAATRKRQVSPDKVQARPSAFTRPKNRVLNRAKKAAKAVLRKVDLPQAPVPVFHAPSQELPHTYGHNFIYLMVKDPNWIFMYWDIQPEHEFKYLAQLGGRWDGISSVLRLYDVTDGQSFKVQDIPLDGRARKWYIEVEANRSYVVELGLCHFDGRYVAMVRSNCVRTPRNGPSEVIDEKWMSINFDEIYALSGGHVTGISSAHAQKIFKKPAGLSSPPKIIKKPA